MKKIEIITRPENLDEVKDILTDCGVSGMMVSNVMGFGKQMGHKQQYRGTQYSVNLVPKIKIDTIVKQAEVANIVAKVTSELCTGKVGDGKIFVYPVEDAIRIRTGENGEEVL